jgi:hypothetical protein
VRDESETTAEFGIAQVEEAGSDVPLTAALAPVSGCAGSTRDRHHACRTDSRGKRRASERRRKRRGGFLDRRPVTPRKSQILSLARFLPPMPVLAALLSTLLGMPRKRLTLEALVAGGTFDPTNFRHRRALDESGPLSDPAMERARRHVRSLRGSTGAKVSAAKALQEFARTVGRRGL